MPTTFLKELKGRIGDAFKSRRSFIQAAQPHDNEEGAQAYLTRVLAGKKPPPLHKVEGWANALKLTGAERQEFLDKCVLSHLPPEVQPRFFAIYEAFQRGNTGIQKRVAELERRLK